MKFKLNTPYLFKKNKTGEENKLSTIIISIEDNYLCFNYDIYQENIYSPFINDNDPLYNADVVEVFISFNGDISQYLEYELSPNNVRFLGIINNPTLESPNLKLIEPNFISSVEKTNYGYNALIKIDLSKIENFDIKKVRFNCFNIYTDMGKRQELYALNPTMCGSFHKAKYFAELEY
jgi:hypothetical protein